MYLYGCMNVQITKDEPNIIFVFSIFSVQIYRELYGLNVLNRIFENYKEPKSKKIY
ncbi:MAG: hypothetical protein RL127_900 [Bacteroidota bacterium]